MSGTSLDGLDIVACTFEYDQSKWEFEVLGSRMTEFPKLLEGKLRQSTRLMGQELILLDVEYGNWLGQETKKFMMDYSLKPDLISSHGYTVFHQPNNGLTLQIGSGHAIYTACKTPVVFDFRSLDVALGGQGAPLVPIGDQLLFAQYDVCLNLGGIANLSAEVRGKRIAYDVVATNMVLNHLSNKVGHAYDRDGAMARNGKVSEQLLQLLENIDYFKMAYPKSLGYEYVSDHILPVIEDNKVSLIDQLATYAEHIAMRIAHDISQIHQQQEQKSVICLITGGGAHNGYLIERLKHHLADHVKLEVPDTTLIDFKEAIIFAFLGLLRMQNEINCLCSVTGASHDSSSGITTGHMNLEI